MNLNPLRRFDTLSQKPLVQRYLLNNPVHKFSIRFEWECKIFFTLNSMSKYPRNGINV